MKKIAFLFLLLTVFTGACHNRSQLVDMVAQFAVMQKSNHGGFAFAKAMADSLPDSIHAHVFLDIHFADSTVERIGMPLRYQHGRWKME